LNSVFIIMPVGSDPATADTKTAILKALARKHGWSPHFPMDRQVLQDDESTSSMLQLLREELRRSSLVIADLSLERPSCYFELGVAESLDLPVAIVAQAGTQIHQAGNRAMARFFDSLEEYGELIEKILTEKTPSK
jgi:nucleoside 2-deoxyribosyltransferase